MSAHKIVLDDDDQAKLDDLIEVERARETKENATPRAGPTEVIRRLIRRAHDARDFALRRGEYADGKGGA